MVVEEIEKLLRYGLDYLLLSVRHVSLFGTICLERPLLALSALNFLSKNGLSIPYASSVRRESNRESLFASRSKWFIESLSEKKKGLFRYILYSGSLA